MKTYLFLQNWIIFISLEIENQASEHSPIFVYSDLEFPVIFFVKKLTYYRVGLEQLWMDWI